MTNIEGGSNKIDQINSQIPLIFSPEFILEAQIEAYKNALRMNTTDINPLSREEHVT